MYNLKKGIVTGAISGSLWGIVVLLISSTTQTFSFDFGLSYDFFIFILAGAGLGIVTGAMYSVTQGVLPKFNDIFKGVILSTGIWLLFFAGSFALSFSTPARYHLHNEQSLQGLLLSVVLGIILGVLWKNKRINNYCS